MDQIKENLFLGDRDDARLLYIKNSPVTAILNVAKEVPLEHHKNIVSVKIGMRDSAEDARIRTEEAVLALKKLVNDGHCVLVHCRHGKSRSPHVLATYLAETSNMDYDDCYEFIRSKRPKVLSYSIGREIKEKFGKQVNWLSSVAQAYVKQHGIDRDSFQQTEEAEWKEAQLGLDLKDMMLKTSLEKQAIVNEAYYKLRQSLHTFSEEELSEKTVPHPLMAKYDHSLEMNRWKGNSKESGEGGDIEMGDLTSEDVL